MVVFTSSRRKFGADAYGVSGFCECCSQGSGVGGFVNADAIGKTGEDVQKAKNFLVGLRSKQIGLISNNTVRTTGLITSIGGPDQTYRPLGTSDLNPIRYAYPGVHNPGSYDLWIQFQFKGKTNLVCNWSRQIQINSSLP